MSDQVTIVERKRGWRFADLRELYRFREVLIVLCWRDISVRYKQSAIGVAWAVLQPVGTMIVFSLVFGKLVGISSGSVPYPIFSYCGLLPWLSSSAGWCKAAARW